jgi:arylsulfatase A-like enzyme
MSELRKGMCFVGTTLCLLGLCWEAVPADEPTAATTRPNLIVILVDDWGYADVGVQEQMDDVRTPSLDRLAREGVRCTAGYATAPQCSPARAGLITGRYQQRFGLDTIPDCPLPPEEITLADRLTAAGYTCGMVGKWHLEPNAQSLRWAREHLPEVRPRQRGRISIPVSAALDFYPHRRGFAEFFVGTQRRFFANMGPADHELKPEGEWVHDQRFRVDVQTEAAIAFLRRNSQGPFFLYLSYFAPHVPLEAPPEYLARFPESLPERRRHALAMMSAVDDGVGRLLDVLAEHGRDEGTLIVFTSDNGAPLQLTREDRPIDVQSSWNGSRNDPWVGEKGMLAEGGIRVPFLLRWKGRLPSGTVYDAPVSTLDIAATALSAAGQTPDARLDGVDLLPYLTGESSAAPHDALYWRFWNQAAVRAGKWKYLRASHRAEYLFDLDSDAHETRNLIAEHADLAKQLREKLQDWTAELQPPGLPDAPLNIQEQRWYQHFFDLPTNRR